MRLRTFCLCLGCALAGLQPLASSAQQAPQPSAQPGAQPGAQSDEIASLAALPAEIRTALGEMADRGGRFSAGCVSLHGEPHSRFKAARVGADMAQVTVERGGIAHFYDTLEFKKVDGHWVAQPPSIPRAPAAPSRQIQARAG